MTFRYQLYGLDVVSAFDLHQARPARESGLAEVRVSLGAPVAARLPEPPGTVVAGVSAPDNLGYSIARSDDGSHLMRFHGACDIAISPDLRDVEVRPALGAPDGLAQVLTVGAMLAYQLYVRGCLVLHASAVDVGGSAVAFAGRSGMGKSTMAALMCADGGRLITDDVLRVDDWPVAPRVRLGASELRIRKGAESLVSRFDAPTPVRASADKRSVLQLGDDADDELPLAGIVIPSPSRDHGTLSLDVLAPKAALFTLMGFPRLAGWRDKAVLETQFTALASLLRSVPVFVAHIPWGPPFERDTAARLREAMIAHPATVGATR